METLHQRRVANEIEFLESLAALNSDKLRLTARAIDPDRSRVDFELLASPAIVCENGAFSVATTHSAEIRFPRFFPAVPIEIYLNRPVFHPNVDPENGFVCLWRQFSPDHTCIDAIHRLRHVIAWKLVNSNPLQVIQPQAIAWLEDPDHQPATPLLSEELQLPEPPPPFLPQRPPAGRRRRLL